MTHDAATGALSVCEAMLALGNETFEAEGALFVRSVAEPSIRDANHVARASVSTSAAIDRLLARAGAEFAHSPHVRFDLDARTPPELEARLALEGYEPTYALVSLLEGELQGPPPRECDIRPMTNDIEWERYAALFRVDWAHSRERMGQPPMPDVGEAMMRARRRKSPPVRQWVAYEDGTPAGQFGSWEGVDGVGQVEDLFVMPEYRNRGIARALLHHCVADARRHGAGPVVIVSDPGDTPKRIYASMGWRPVAVRREYRIDKTAGG